MRAAGKDRNPREARRNRDAIAGRKRLPETPIAAIQQAAGVSEVFTLNPRDFEVSGLFTIRTMCQNYIFLV